MSGFRSIRVYVPERVNTFGLAAATEIFADRCRRDCPRFEVQLCADRPGMVRTDSGLAVPVEHGLTHLPTGDLVIVLPSTGFRADRSAGAIGALRAAHARGAIVAAHDAGTYLVAAAGLLDGARATTHWRWADDLAARFPAVQVTATELYVDVGSVVTGGGAGAAVDMYLHLIRREHGISAANTITQELALGPHREGDQSQYVPAAVSGDTRHEHFSAVFEWMTANMPLTSSIDDLAARAFMSTRTFTRRFRAATGTTPYSWLRNHRMARVEHLLETTELSIEEIARHVGYASATVLREQFIKLRGMPPSEYRKAFRPSGRRTSAADSRRGMGGTRRGRGGRACSGR